MVINKQTLNAISPAPGLDIPAQDIFNLPEKVLQFGTGVLLRGLPDYFIDIANKQGIFNGRIVVVKSTESDSSAFDRQDGLYTVCVRGIENGNTVKENIINASISRVLSAKTEWQKILDLAKNPELQIILSNTTEVGIRLTDDNIHAQPPSSYPGKLLAFLHARYVAFGGTPASGMVIVPTELITDNGDQLLGIIMELAHRNHLEFAFIEWLENHNTFCNSLVDRIVPGKPNAAVLAQLQQELGYTDELLTMSEVFRLWAIQGNEKVKNVLSFAQADANLVITDDITLFKELKLRILNGTHTFNCGTAFLAGFNLTREAVGDKVYSRFTTNLMQNEIAPSIPFAIDPAMKKDFANKVFERFGNPFIDHQWQSITTQYTSKMKMRNVPLLQRWFELNSTPPPHMSLGFAAYILYMRSVENDNGKYYAIRNGEKYLITDDQAAWFYENWQQHTPESMVEAVCKHTAFWETDLSVLPGFVAAVQHNITRMLSEGINAVIEDCIQQTQPAHEA